MGDLHRHETAGVGLRAPRITGAGSEHARLLRLVLLSYTRWPGRDPQAPWPCNATLAARTGLDRDLDRADPDANAREVKRALAVLRSAGILTTRWGKRPKSKPGRLIALDLHAPCKALAPAGHDVRNLWAICRSIRARPAALITMMVGAYMLASDAAGGEIEDWAPLGCSASALRRFIGQADNASWSKRLRALEALGLIRRDGRRVEVSPPRAWFMLAVGVERSSDAAGIDHAGPMFTNHADLHGRTHHAHLRDAQGDDSVHPARSPTQVRAARGARPHRDPESAAPTRDEHPLDWMWPEDGRADDPRGMIREVPSWDGHDAEETNTTIDLGEGPDLPAPPGFLRCGGPHDEWLPRGDDRGEDGRGWRTGTDGDQGQAESRPESDRGSRARPLHVLRKT